MFYNKYGHPNGIGLYGPGKIKISKEKPISASSRGTNRWNKSPNASKNNRTKQGKIMTNFHNRKVSSNLEEIREMKKRKKDFDNSFTISKASINNFMNNSHQKNDVSPIRNSHDTKPDDSKERKHGKKSNSKLSALGGTDKSNAIKEMLKMKQDENKQYNQPEQTTKGISGYDKHKPQVKSGNNFKTRKPSADQSKSERNALNEANKSSNRSRKSHSSKPTDRASRADSRDTSTRSNKEDTKANYQNDKPANIQAPDSDKDGAAAVNEDTNIVTKFAFATRVGYIPNNPYKVNQDAYILAPNIMKLPAYHYFGV